MKRKKKRKKILNKKLMFKLCISDIIPLSRFLLLKELVSLPFPFYLHQFLFNFFKYSFSNLPSSYPYNIFAIYFPGNSFLLKFFSSTIFSFSCLLTFTLILPLNSTTNSFVFSKSSSFFQLSYSTVNLFHYTKYFTTLLTFCLFNIFSTFYFSTPSTSIGFASSFFYPSI